MSWNLALLLMVVNLITLWFQLDMYAMRHDCWWRSMKPVYTCVQDATGLHAKCRRNNS